MTAVNRRFSPFDGLFDAVSTGWTYFHLAYGENDGLPVSSRLSARSRRIDRFRTRTFGRSIERRRTIARRDDRTVL